MQRYPINVRYYGLVYKVVNIILFNIINIMKVILLLNDCNKQESLMSESVMVIQINLLPCKGNNLIA
jgi:hypothetical protein